MLKSPPQPKRCRHFAAKAKEKGATFSRNPLFYLVELAGVEPASGTGYTLDFKE
ncbi:hypothetical protein ACOJCX_002151 [Cronobacter dublinensis]